MTNDYRIPFKTLVLTFYDSLGTYPFTATYYVRADATDEQIQTLVRCIEALSVCVLGRYKVDSERVEMPDYKQKVSQSTAVAGHKWRISFKDQRGTTKSHTIPGRDPAYSYFGTKGMRGKFGNQPDTDHPTWQALFAIFMEIGASNKGRPIRGSFKAKAVDYKWPPKGA